MKLLFASHLNGNPDFYEYLAAQAGAFDAMFWVGNLTNAHAGDAAEQSARVESAVGEIQSQGCRVFASRGAEDQGSGPWLWLERQGAFVAPGLVVTMLTGEKVNRARLRGLRKASWEAGALWIAVCSEPVVPSMLAAGATDTMLLWPQAALQFGPDMIVCPQRGPAMENEQTDWCKRRAHTWVLTPGQGNGNARPETIVLDTFRWSVTRYSAAGTEHRDISALRERVRSTTRSARQMLAA